MGSLNEVHCYLPFDINPNDLCEKVISTVLDLEQKYSRFKPETIVTKINASAGKESVELDEETAMLLRYADVCFKKSLGLFDITSGVLRKVWDFKKAQIPDETEIKKIKKSIGWSKVSLTSHRIHLPEAGMEIDLGGIVKEYAADRVAAVLREHDVQHALINLGGDIHILGPHASGKSWNVGIHHPRIPNSSIATIKLTQGALATSGDYERYFEAKGKRYCHILNPKTGWPVEDLQSVTICADSCLIAGSLATITMLLGKIRGLKLLNESKVSYFVVDRAGQVNAQGPFQF